MRKFNVTVLKDGKRQQHAVLALSKEEAIKVIRETKKAKPILVREIPPSSADKLQIALNQVYRGALNKDKVKPEEIIVAFRQLALTINAGISIHSALEDLIAFSANERLKYIFKDILMGINSGKTLTEAFQVYAEELGNLVVSFVSLGEQTGSLAHALSLLTEALEEMVGNVAKFKKALRYPIMLMVAMAIAFVVLIMMVVPKFKEIFESLNAELPLPTRFLLKTEWALSNFGGWILGGLIAAVWVLRKQYKASPLFRAQADKFVLKVKLIGQLTFLHNVNQYVSTLSLLLQAGISLEGALESASAMTPNLYLKEKFETVNEAIKRGVTLTDALRATQVFEPTTLQMVAAGEQSGELDKMLGVASNYYKVRYDNIIDNLSAYIEPIMTFFIACMVLLLALGIFLPMWDISKAAKNA